MRLFWRGISRRDEGSNPNRSLGLCPKIRTSRPSLSALPPAPLPPWQGQFQLTDHQYSPVVFIDDTGIVTQRATYDAYGNRVVGNVGDLNLDGFTDDTDFVLFSAAYNNFTDVIGDLNFDGVTDDTDFVLFSAAYNALTPAQPDPRLTYAGYLSVSLGKPGDPFYLQLYLARNRWYDPGAGRWIQRDPAGYVDGLHLYLYVRGNPLAFIDPTGLQARDDRYDPEVIEAKWRRQQEAKRQAQVKVKQASDAQIAAEMLKRGAQSVKEGAKREWEQLKEQGAAYPAHKLINAAVNTYDRIHTSASNLESHTTGAKSPSAGTMLAATLMELVPGGEDVVSSVSGYSPSQDRMLSTKERVEAGLRGGGQILLTAATGGSAAIEKAGASAAVEGAEGRIAATTAANKGPALARVRSANPTPSRGLGDIGSHGPVDPTTALSGAEKWLGQGYREIAPGVFRSSDGLRQFRMTSRDLLPTHGNIGPHVHFESPNPSGGPPLENLHLPIKP